MCSINGFELVQDGFCIRTMKGLHSRGYLERPSRERHFYSELSNCGKPHMELEVLYSEHGMWVIKVQKPVQARIVGRTERSEDDNKRRKESETGCRGNQRLSGRTS